MAKNSKRANNDVEVLEAGNIYFCYRPKVEHDEAEGLKEVQRFYVVLKPKGEKVYRMLAVGQKHLPDVEQHGQQTWAFVDSVTSDAREIEESLRERHYQTKTRGERTLPAARPSGEGTYEIVRHDNHTHLVYALELPENPGDVQRDFNIENEGSYILQIKNPEQGAPKGLGLKEDQQARFPEKLQQRFRGRRFVGAESPEFLNYEGAELLLIAASEDISKELGLEIDADHETETTADMIRDLHMRKSRHPIEPLFQGTWR